VPFHPDVGLDEDAGRLARAILQPVGQLAREKVAHLLAKSEVFG
jgi:hypothetical protein